MSNGKSGMNESGPVANHSPAWSTAFSEVSTTAVMAVQGRTTDSSGDLSRLDVNLEAIRVGSLGVTSADRFATRQFVRIAGARKIGSTRPRCAAAAVMRLVECNPSSRTHPWLAGVNVHRVQHLPVAGVSYGSRVPQVTAALNSHHLAGGELGNDSLTTRLRKRRTSTTGHGGQGSYGGIRQ